MVQPAQRYLPATPSVAAELHWLLQQRSDPIQQRDLPQSSRSYLSAPLICRGRGYPANP
jgi:hypothetical protein